MFLRSSERQRRMRVGDVIRGCARSMRCSRFVVPALQDAVDIDAGVWMWSGSSWPGSTSSSTSTTQTLPAVAATGLKLRAVLR